MRAFFALMRREFLEHRGAFFYAPAVLLLLVVAFIAVSVASHHIDVLIHLAPGLPSKAFDILYFTVAAVWWMYLALTLFFFFADAFNADTRNNGMLFWKSMPQSDFKILMSKFIAGLTLFPALILVAALVTGVILGILATILPNFVSGFTAPAIGDIATGWAAVSAVIVVYLVLALLWYAPFFAWVGALSTAVGRWSIPLAIVVPLVLSLFEGQLEANTGFTGGAFLTFLRERLDVRYDSAPILAALFSPAPLDVPQVAQGLVEGVNWPSLIGGLVFALAALYAASQYRRRVIKG